MATYRYNVSLHSLFVYISNYIINHVWYKHSANRLESVESTHTVGYFGGVCVPFQLCLMVNLNEKKESSSMKVIVFADWKALYIFFL